MKSILIHVYIKATPDFLLIQPQGRTVSSHAPCTCKKGMHSVMRIGKMVNAKVMTDDLRDLDTEPGGWNLAPLRK